MLHLIEFKLFDCPPHRIGIAALADMRLKAKSIGFRKAIEWLEVLDRLRQFVTGKINTTIEAQRQKRFHPAPDIFDSGLTGDTELRDPLDIGNETMYSC